MKGFLAAAGLPATLLSAFVVLHAVVFMTMQEHVPEPYMVTIIFISFQNIVTSRMIFSLRLTAKTYTFMLKFEVYFYL